MNIIMAMTSSEFPSGDRLAAWIAEATELDFDRFLDNLRNQPRWIRVRKKHVSNLSEHQKIKILRKVK
jgi:hypothetical protein